MALNIGDNFSYLGAKPLDTRRVFASKAAMDAVNLSTVYEGMIAYAKAEDKYYRLKSGTWIEFKTGSGISTWKTNTSYSVGDIVLNDNKIYCCITAHTSTSFDSDFSNWDDINSYLALWQSSTPYRVGNVVVASGKIYQCKTAHVSGASFSDTNWSEIGGGGSLTSWTTNTDYKVGDIVKYDNTLYKCTTAHTSSDFDTERVNWEIFGQDKIKVEDWQTGVYYENKQLVLYRNNVYRCNTSHTSDSSFDLDGAKWDIVYTSVNSWIGNAYYKVGTTIVRQGTLYRCSTDHVSGATFDTTEAGNWVVIGDSVPVITKWATNTDYDENDVVIRDGVIYQCLADHKSTTFEADKDNWQANNVTYIWQDNTLYFAGQIVINDGIAYIVDITFISGATFSDTNLTPIKILLSQDSKNVLQYKSDGLFGDDPEGLTSAEITNLINNFNPSGGGIMSIEDWEANHGYLVKNVVFYSGAVYRCKIAHTSTTIFDATKWDNVTGGSGGGVSIDDWATGVAYGVDEWVRHDNILYKCKTAHTSSTFSSDRTNWDAITAEQLVGATASAKGKAGIVPEPQSGDNIKYLRGDGTWKSPSLTELAIKTDILWEGGSTSQVQGDILSLNYPYTDYDRIACYAGTLDGISDVCYFSPSKENHVFVSPATQGTDFFNAYMLFAGSTSTFEYLGKGTTNTTYLKRIEGIKFTTTAGNVQDMTGATQTTVGTHGLVPAPQADSMNKFLAGDGTWKIPSGSLSVVKDLLWEGVAYTPDVNLPLNHVCTDYDYVIISFGGVWNSVNLNIGQTIIDPNKELWAYVSGNETEAGTNPSSHVASILFTSTTATIKKAYGLGGNWHVKRIEGIKFVNPNEYTPTEKRIGTWVDGSPLYQKTIISTNVVCSAGGGATKIGSIGSFSSIIGFEGVQSSDGLQYVPLDGCWTGASGTTTLTGSNSWHGWLSIESNGDVMLGQSLNLTVAKCYVTIKYTK